MKKNYEWLIDNPQYILFECISGSHAYGTNTLSSDIDKRGVFILPEEDILSNGYIEQLNDTKNDMVFYEIRRFLELLQTNNPTVLELLNCPEDCITIKHPLFAEIIKHSDKFITKQCKNSFAGYAVSQIKKARGLDKKQNWEKEKIERKSVLDFCFVPLNAGAMPVKEFLKINGWKQENCGLASVQHMRDGYALFYERSYKQTFGFKGIVSDEETANDISLSSIPKELQVETYMQFNKDGYSIHCREYKEYQEWLKKRNVTRWTEVKEHGQQIDGKNMLHTRRLLEMAEEIAQGKGIIVRRNNAAELLKIRRGEVNLKDLLDWAEAKVLKIDDLFENSDLPETVSEELIYDWILQIRKDYYGHYTK